MYFILTNHKKRVFHFSQSQKHAFHFNQPQKKKRIPFKQPLTVLKLLNEPFKSVLS